MNTADERLRAAARDAARIFPTGEELPPLRLPDLTSGHRRTRVRAAMGGIGRTRPWLSPLAAAAAVAAIAVVAALVAPGNQPAGGSGVLGGDGGPGVKLTRGQIGLLTATTKGPWVTYALADNATQTLIERCMHAHGLVYHPFFQRPAEAATMATEVLGVPGAGIGLAARQADGYGFYSKGVQHVAHPGAEDQPSRQTKYVRSLPAKTRQRYAATDDGCLAAARRQVYGSRANFYLVVSGWTEMQAQLNTAVRADPAFPAALARWSACMTAHGYNYPGPDNLWNRLGPRIYERPTPAGHALEIRTAVQDYRCSQAVRLIATIRALQAHHARYVSKALAAKIVRLTKVFARALKEARRLHVPGLHLTNRH